MQFRKERMQSLLQETLNNIILREIEVSGTLVTLTDVQISSDLENATIGVSVIPKEKEDEIIRSLGDKRKHFRHLLIKKLNWRLIPELNFEIDEGAESAATVEKILLEEKNNTD